MSYLGSWLHIVIIWHVIGVVGSRINKSRIILVSIENIIVLYLE